MYVVSAAASVLCFEVQLRALRRLRPKDHEVHTSTSKTLSRKKCFAVKCSKYVKALGKAI